MKPLSSYMKPDLIVFLDATMRDEAIQTLVDTLGTTNTVSDAKAFNQAILDREKLVSTGIGMGVALPHAKMEICHSFFICLGILNKGVNWKAIDNAPVRIVFMIGGPDDKQTEYLQILSNLTQFIKKEDIRKKLLTLNSKEAIMELFNNPDN
jgi:PTS system nitrogen regulatory IIA component